ncbi:MAG: Maf family protein [Aquificaceae bacterium]
MRLLILASQSKRRVQILTMLGFKFLVIPSYVEENHSGNPLLTARRLAFKKAFAVWKDYKFATVIGADTVVVLDKRILGKPRDEQEAKDMLRDLSGRWHRVITAVCVISPKARVHFHDMAWVKFRKIEEEEIEEYVKTQEPMDKAGAYAVQGVGAKFVEKIKGDFYTVMGLPASKTYRVLKDVLD